MSREKHISEFSILKNSDVHEYPTTVSRHAYILHLSHFSLYNILTWVTVKCRCQKSDVSRELFCGSELYLFKKHAANVLPH